MKTLKEQLETYSHQYLSIGITQDGSRRNSISVPWSRTASAYNMKTPDIYMTDADLHDPEIRALLSQYHINGFYTFCPMEDYSILEEFPEIWDLFILYGQNLHDLSFLLKMPQLFMLYVQDAHLPDLDPLFRVKPEAISFYSRCVGFGGCTIGDVSRLEELDERLSELVVFCPEGSNERSRWEKARTLDFTYYEYRV